MGNALPKLVTTGVLGVILGFLGAKSTQKKLPPSPDVPEPSKDGVAKDIEAARAARAADRPGHMTANRILADKHRVAVTQWTLIGASAVNYEERFEEPRSAARPNGGECPLTDDLDSLFSWVKEHGYDGLEMTVDDFRVRWFPAEENYNAIVEKVAEASKKAGVPIIGSLYHVTDGCARLRLRTLEDTQFFHLLTAACLHCAAMGHRARELGAGCTLMVRDTTSISKTKTFGMKWGSGSAMRRLSGVDTVASKSVCRITL